MRIYDRNGVPMSVRDWQARACDYGYKRVARSKILDAANPAVMWDVSTVWLGLDHNWGDGPPHIFETMVFAEGSSMDSACERYSTLAEAELGHRAMVVTVAAELGDAIVMDADEND